LQKETATGSQSRQRAEKAGTGDEECECVSNVNRIHVVNIEP